MRTTTTNKRERNRRADESRRQSAARADYEGADRYYRRMRAQRATDEEIRAARRVRDAAFENYLIATGRLAA